MQIIPALPFTDILHIVSFLLSLITVRRHPANNANTLHLVPQLINAQGYCWWHAPETESCQDVNIVVTGCTRSCRYDNLQFSQRRQRSSILNGVMTTLDSMWLLFGSMASVASPSCSPINCSRKRTATKSLSVAWPNITCWCIACWCHIRRWSLSSFVVYRIEVKAKLTTIFRRFKCYI